MSKQTKDIPKGYKMTELGPLPEEWEVESVENVTEFSKKPRDLKIPETEDVIFIPMEVIPDNGSEITKWEYRKYKNISSGSFVRKGDFVVAKITPSFENGKQALLDNLPAEYAYATTEVWALHANSKGSIHLPFLYNYIRLPSIRGEVAGAMEGSTGRQRVPKHVIAKLKIPLPPLPEQKKIASVLSAVQQAKEKTAGAIAALGVLKKSLMKHLFTYGPVPVDEAENVELKETEIGEIPAEWELSTLGSEGEFKYGYTTSATDKNTGTKFLRITDIRDDGRINWNSVPFAEVDGDNINKYILDQGDILFARIGATTGKTCIISNDRPEAVFASYLIRLRVGSRLDSQYTFYYTGTERYWKMVEAGKEGKLKKGLNSQQLKGFSVPVPSTAEQTDIAKMLSAVDTKLDTLENEKQALDDLFRTLLHDLMTARIRVNEAEVPV